MYVGDFTTAKTGKLVVSGDEHGAVTFWDLDAMKRNGVEAAGHPVMVNAVALSGDGAALASGSVKGQLVARFLSQRLGMDLFVSKPEARGP